MSTRTSKRSRLSRPTDAPFASVGKPLKDIDVKISSRIIKLFSEGLYKSPTKAIEELVANSFDAGATTVQVFVTPDLADKTSHIVVIDNGQSMGPQELAQHWIIGASFKRQPSFKSPKNRKQIGRFGIGKLATYVLAEQLTHICKFRAKYYAATMNYQFVPAGDDGGISAKESITLPLRQLTAEEAKKVLGLWTQGDSRAHKALKLFGREAPPSWTVAIMSDLKDMAAQLRLGRLRWVLSTAMPIGADFSLFLDGNPVLPNKEKGKRIKTWIIGKDAIALPRPAPGDQLQATTDLSTDRKSSTRYGLTHAELGRITGKVELFEELLTGGKRKFEHSHGFFVYVRNRLINVDDEYFGIPSNKLRHGTFSRFRCEVHIDRLDDELRSSRESVRETSLLIAAQNILEGLFNLARSKHESFENDTAPGARASRRVASTPYSLTRRPIVGLVRRVLDRTAKPLLLSVPAGLTTRTSEALLRTVETRAESDDGLVLRVILGVCPSITARLYL